MVGAGVGVWGGVWGGGAHSVGVSPGWRQRSGAAACGEQSTGGGPASGS